MGRPIRPTSASSFKRSSIHPSSPLVPFSANRGACRVEVREALVPVPPTPRMGDHGPLTGLDQIDPAPVDGFGLRPGGTWITRSSPRAPCRFDPSPCRPRPPRKCLLPFSAPRSRLDASQTSTTSPPWPPSPPSGPPMRHVRLAPKARRSHCRRPRPQPRSSPCRTSLSQRRRFRRRIAEQSVTPRARAGGVTPSSPHTRTKRCTLQAGSFARSRGVLGPAGPPILGRAWWPSQNTQARLPPRVLRGHARHPPLIPSPAEPRSCGPCGPP